VGRTEVNWPVLQPIR